MTPKQTRQATPLQNTRPSVTGSRPTSDATPKAMAPANNHLDRPES